MKLSTAFGVITLADFGCAQSLVPIAREYFSGLDISTLNRADCDRVATEVKEALPPAPYMGIRWLEKKPKRRQEWYHAAVSDGEFSNNTNSKTIYCGSAGNRISGQAFANNVPLLYCNGTEQAAGLHIQKRPWWINGHCQFSQFLDHFDFSTIQKYCGCKNQPPIPPPGAEVLSTTIVGS